MGNRYIRPLRTQSMKRNKKSIKRSFRLRLKLKRKNNLIHKRIQKLRILKKKCHLKNLMMEAFSSMRTKSVTMKTRIHKPLKSPTTSWGQSSMLRTRMKMYTKILKKKTPKKRNRSSRDQKGLRSRST